MKMKKKKRFDNWEIDFKGSRDEANDIHFFIRIPSGLI